MIQGRQPGHYRIRLDKTWRFEEFSELPHLFNQVYALNFTFHEREVDDISEGFRAFPWIGGYSAVNFYRTLSHRIPRRLEPVVQAIVFQSPGYIDLGLYVEAAKQVGVIIGSLAAAGTAAHSLYNKIRKEASKRELLNIEVQQRRQKLKQDDIEFLMRAAQQLGATLQFEKLPELNTLTGDSLITLKILMSYYRRLEPLVEFQKEGKANFPS